MKQEKFWYKRWWAIILLIILGIIIISLLLPNKNIVEDDNYLTPHSKIKGLFEEKQNDTPITLETIEVCNARNYIGKEIIVQGKIVQVSTSKGTTFLNFGSTYPNHCFYGVIFSSSSYKFPENIKGYFEGKIVKMRGVIEEYQGKPQIILENSEQIGIVN